MSEKKHTVETTFTAKDLNYTSVVGKISHGFEHAQEKLKDFRRETGMTTLGMLGLGYGLTSWVEHTKEANAEFANTQKSIAGLLAGSLEFAKGTSEIERYNRSLALSNDITHELDETSGRFVQPLESVAAAYRGILTATAPLHLAQKQVMDLTEESIATSKRFGVDGERSALAIARALQTGTVRGFEPFDQKLRQTLGNMNKLTQAQRFEHIQRALKGSMDIADAMSGGIGGALTRARHVVDDLIRDATGPVFKEVAKDLQAWSKHIREVKENGKPLIDVFSTKLVDGFHAIKEASRFIHEHWIAIAALYGGMKLTTGAGGIAESLGGIGGMFGASTKGIQAFTAKLGAATAGLGLFAVAIAAAVEFLDKRDKQSIQSQLGAKAAVGAAGIIGHLVDKAGALGLNAQQLKIAGKQIDELRHSGVIGAKGLDKAALAYHLGELSQSEQEDIASKYGIARGGMTSETGEHFDAELTGKIADAVEKQLQPLLTVYPDLLSKFADKASAAANDKLLKTTGPPQYNIHQLNLIQKFEDQDPDRIFVRFKRGLENEVSSRTQALTAEPQGD